MSRPRSRNGGEEAAEGQLSFALGGPAAPEPRAPEVKPEAKPVEARPALPTPPPPAALPATPAPPANDAKGDDRAASKVTAPAEPVPAKPKVYAVAELVRSARMALESRFADVRVEGEISGCKKSPQGHLYFTLKDSEAQIDCVIFGREAQRLKFRLEDGLQVRCRGRLTLFEARGRFQFCVVEIEPAGAGALALAFEQLKKRLAAEGLFDPARKRRLPFLPRRIGVVTSPSGAVIRDIVRVAHRRFPIRLLLSPTPVQGDGAAPQIIFALERVVRAPDVDVVIVARGGGSLEDLWAFNDEALARAIARCPVPVISAVGHETDFTIADFVADVRAPTPSAAAEIAVPLASQLRDDLGTLGRRTSRAMKGHLRDQHLALTRLRGSLGDPRRIVNQRRQELDELQGRASDRLRAALARRRADLRATEGRLFRAHPQRRIADQRALLAGLERRLRTGVGGRLAPRKQALAALERRMLATVGTTFGPRRRRLDGLWGKLEALSPLRVLERGYSLARTPEGHVITAIEELAPGAPLVVTLKDGEVHTRVDRTEPRRRDDEEPKP